MPDLRDILNDEEQVNEDELLKYIQDDLAEEDKQSFENRVAAASGFITDAVDGLRAFKNKQQLSEHVKQLNRNLEKQLAARKLQKDKRKIKEFRWIVLTVLVILLICIVGYIAIHLYKNS